MTGFNNRIIEEFRANDGVVTTAGFGDSLVLVHSVGAVTGEERINPLMAIERDGSWLIAASAAGASRHPAWYFNLLGQPDVTIETGTSTVDVRATDLAGDERDVAWKLFTDRSPGFREYEVRAGDRVIPVVRLDPR